MTSITSPLSLLEAVNIVLDNDGEAPVASLDESGFSEAARALARINEVSRLVQTDGWAFNTDYAREFTPAVNGEISLAETTIQVRPAYLSAGRNLIERGRKLYDSDENTYVFTSKVYLDVIECLEWDDLPAYVRHYITIRAARIYQARGTGSPQQNSFTQQDEVEAMVSFKRADRRARRRGTFREASGAYSIRRRPL